MTEYDIKNIRYLKAMGFYSVKKLAKIYGISQEEVREIVNAD